MKARFDTFLEPEEKQAIQELTTPGGFFELAEENVLGEEVEVFKNRMKSLRDVLENARNFGDTEFMVMEERRYTYQNFFDLTCALAKSLKEDFQIQKGDRVGIFAANSPEWVMSFFASVSIGAIVSAYNGRWTTDEVLYGINHSTPKLLIGDTKRLARLEGIDLKADLKDGLKTVDLEKQFHNLTARAPDAELPTDEILEDDPCLILYTSGTTGKPKGATVSHRGLLGFIQTTMFNAMMRSRVAELKQQGSQPESDESQPDPKPRPQVISLGTSPLFHVSGLHGTLLMSVSTGGKIIYVSGRFDPEKILEIIQRERVTQFSALGNSGFQIASHPNLKNYDLSSITSVGLGGAPASPSLQNLLRETFPNAAAALGMGYGSSETTAVVATIGGEDYAKRPESCGKSMVGTEIEIRGEDNSPLPPMTQGEIYSRSAYTMLGYWNDPEATSQTIGEGRWLATGDVGHLSEEGYLYINSRARDMILRNAENIYPIEIEYRLDAHPDIAESAVIGVEHPEMGQEIKAVIVGVDSKKDLDIEEIKTFLKNSLADYKVPTIWKVRKEPLPRNPAGKIQKLKLEG